MAVITPSILGLDTCPSTKGTIYTSGTGETARIKTVVFHNYGAGDNEVILYGKTSGGSSRQLGRQVLGTNSTWVYEQKHPIILANGDVLEAFATNASEVNYVVSGAESTTPTSGIIPKHIAGVSLSYTYTVPTSTAFYLYHVILYAKSGAWNSGINVNIDIIDNTLTAYTIFNVCMRQDDYLVFDAALNLQDGWQLDVYGDSANLDVWIDGAEE